MAAKPKSMRLKRFEDPAADVVWAGLMTLDVALQHRVLRELASDLALDVVAPKTATQRVRAAVAALHDCYDLIGHSPSVKEYRRLRDELPELGLPAESNVRKWLGGGWNTCLDRAFLPTVSDGDFLAAPLEEDFTKEELLKFLRLCAAELKMRPRIVDYGAWVRRKDVAERFPRRPMTPGVFNRHGGFLKLQVEAGVINEEQARRAANGRILPSSYRYSDEEMNDALREVAGRLRPGIGDRSPRYAEYEQERIVIQKESEKAGKPRTIPSAAAISKRHNNCWDDALEAAGLPPLGGRATTSNARARRPTYTREDKERALPQAWTDCGNPFYSSTYDDWRDAQLDQAEAEGRVINIPGKEGMVSEFGGWQQACIACIPGYTPPGRRRRRQG